MELRGANAALLLEIQMTRKELIALLDEVQGACDGLYEDAPDQGDYYADDMSNAGYENAAASFCDSWAWCYFRELATRLSDAIYKLETGAIT
jgi:hypothetical protein